MPSREGTLHPCWSTSRRCRRWRPADTVVCVGNVLLLRCMQGCPAGQKFCGDACYPDDSCCSGADCAANAVCPGVGQQCVSMFAAKDTQTARWHRSHRALHCWQQRPAHNIGCTGNPTILSNGSADAQHTHRLAACSNTARACQAASRPSVFRVTQDVLPAPTDSLTHPLSHQARANFPPCR